MKLIIAEKPMLARAIADALPGTGVNKNGYTVKGNYTVISAFGHLLTLKEPEDYDNDRYRRWSLDTLPIYFSDWGKKPGDGKTERLELIGQLLKESQCVIHAGDPDDEGQYLIDEILQWFNYSGPVYRLATGDTTESALKKALSSLKNNSEFVNAGWSAHARSVADIMVGFNFSRYFSLLNPHVKMLTVGRVQTPTLGLVVTRDLSIENHSKLSYFNIYGNVELHGHTVKSRFEPPKDDPNLEDGRITDSGYAEDIVQSLMGAELKNIKISVRQISEQPPLPFNLVKLQTYCSNKFGYEPSQTLALTQSLRDKHNAITYNRSDCQYLSEDQYRESPSTIRQVLSNLAGIPAHSVFEKLPLDPSIHSAAFNDKNITAHTAIIPQNKRIDPGSLSEEELNVYLAIVKYYLAQFLPPAEKKRTNLDVSVEAGMLRAVSTETVFPGYLQLIKPEKKKDEDEDDEEDSHSDLSTIPAGTYEGKCADAYSEEKETKAPPRYTKASLNEDMTRIAKYVTDPKAKALLLSKDKDKKGENGSIGTSATRASIIDNLEARGFIESRGKQIRSTQLGRELYRILPDELKKPDMTGYWWAIQESIQEGSLPWTALTDSVLDMIRKVIKTEYPKVDAYHVPESMRRGKLLLGSCPRCGRDIVEGTAGFGCSGYKEGCKFVIWKTAKSGMMSKCEITADIVHDLLASGWKEDCRAGEAVNIPNGRKRSAGTVYFKRLYSEAKKKTYPGLVYLIDEGPESAYGASFALQEIVNEPPKPLGKCPRCGCEVIEGKNGYGCSGYKDGCKFVIWKKSKSGMMSKSRITTGIVKKLLKGSWIDDTDSENGMSRKRTETVVHMRKLYSESKGKTYTGDVYLTDDGPGSSFGASFRLAAVTNDGPEILGKCPRCGKEVVEGSKGFGCLGFRDGCRFTIWKSSKMKLLANITFTKTDAKKFLSGKAVHKKKLLDKKGLEFSADIVMVEESDNPYGPVFRVVQGTIDAAGISADTIKTETVTWPPHPKSDDTKE